ncbi:MAG: hypothetical protein AVDCRST_MAG19-185 [uncultured Thermomicrobiales bacterium]|uniref:Uncharacterized protein n=1 Tax=uncultured Thermomicrobiales bacterium TaxID=1645740 RepID=A0A6J4UDB2_9BACT|nr:MAG: hypothetical protein AVDCRST_MAG19-185 [uncultured Thermomicrobiales bacterium]
MLAVALAAWFGTRDEGSGYVEFGQNGRTRYAQGADGHWYPDDEEDDDSDWADGPSGSIDWRTSWRNTVGW